MKSPVLARLCLISALGSVTILGACSTSPEGNVAEACNALKEYSTSLDTLAGSITPEASVDSVRQAREGVDEAKNKVDDALKSVESDRVAALEESWKSLQGTLDDLDGDATLATAAQTLAAKATEVQRAREELSSSLSCS